MNLRNDELQEYVINEIGISRTRLNVMCFIGATLMGIFTIVAFHMLGRKKEASPYFLLLIILVVFSIQSGLPLWTFSVPICIVGWIHANSILSKLQRDARLIVDEIDSLPIEERSIDAVMTKGVLQHKVFSDRGAAAITLGEALNMPGGDAELLRLSGGAMMANKKYMEAKQFLERALPLSSDEGRVKQIQSSIDFLNARSG